MSQSINSTEKFFFDLHTAGTGYIQRVRNVPVKNGRKSQPFLACTIAALVGPANDPTYRYFDVKVSGAEAKKLVQGYISIDDPKQRPLVQFRIGDLWVDPFIRPKGERQGQAAASLKARLLKAEVVNPDDLKQVEFHELITRGIGYLNRPMEVTPTDGDAFLSCTIAALSGAVDTPDYRYFDTVVATTDAQHLVRRCMQAVSEEKKVLVSFRLNDMKAEPYIRTKGEHAGEAGANLKSKLIHIGSIKIDGQLVYSDKPETELEPVESESVESVDCAVDDDTASSVDHADEAIVPDAAARVPVSQATAQAASF